MAPVPDKWAVELDPSVLVVPCVSTTFVPNNEALARVVAMRAIATARLQRFDETVTYSSWSDEGVQQFGVFAPEGLD